MIHLKSADLKKEKIESLVIPVCEDKNIHEDETILSLIRIAKKVKAFKGDKDDEVILYNLSEINAKIIIFLGIGKIEKVDMESLRTMAGKAVKSVIRRKHTEVLIAVPLAAKAKMDMQNILEAMMEGTFLGNHLFDKYKKEKKLRPIERIDFLVTSHEIKKYRKSPFSACSCCRLQPPAWLRISFVSVLFHPKQ